jgi:hypothetical protein
VEINDSPQIIHWQHTGREFCDMPVDQFEEMVEYCMTLPPGVVPRLGRARAARLAAAGR